MDLGIKGKRALVCGASKGLGRACAEALAEAGVELVINARTAETLEQTAADIRVRYAVPVTTVATDVTTEAGQQTLIDAAGAIDILINNAGGPPPGNWRDWNRDDFIAALDANMLSAVALIKALVPSMIDNGWGRVVNITSIAVRQPIGVLGLSNSARAGLTGYVAGVSRDVAEYGVTINNLLPGLHATERLEGLDKFEANQRGIETETMTRNRAASIPAKRYGTAAEFGAVCAFMCSQHAAYMVGQNVLLDGGAFNSTM